MVKVRNEDRVRQRLAKLRGAEVVAEVGKALFVAANRIQVSAQHSITEGAISGRFHVPSSPGDPPKADTHTLDRQIESELVEPLKAQVSSNAPYSAFLEFGTSRMEPRPFMRPALAKERQGAIDLVTATVNRIVARATR